jgi:aerobic carbon-monoxide dehydrogenase medium subunit
MKPAPFTYHVPATVDEAVSLLAQLADARVIAGGQSVVPMMAFRLARPTHLIDINRIAELERLAVEGGVLRIGAIVRHAALEEGGGGGLQRLLATMAHSIAHMPIRNRGTFCGSLAHADPSSEWCLAAVTLSAEIVLRSAKGSRVVPAETFLLGIMTTAIEADELIAECRIPLLAEDAKFGFHEMSRRAGDFAMAAGLAIFRLKGGRIAEPRIGIGGVEPMPRRLAEVEAMLDGAAPGDASFDAAADLAAASVDPMEDAANTPEFRRQITRAVIRRALGESLR